MDGLTLAMIKALGGSGGGGDIPTKVSDLVNDAGYQTASDVETKIKAHDDGANVAVNSYSDLPRPGDTSKRYFVKQGGLSPNMYDEYVWMTNHNDYEKIAPKEIDLSGYVQKTQTVNGKALNGNIELKGSDITVSASDTDKLDVAFGKKADKVANATNNNLAALDASGNLKDSGKAISDIASPSSTAPSMDGTAAIGESTEYARADHVHPTDTSRASAEDINVFYNAKTVTGNPATITDGVEGAILGDVKVAIEPVQDLHGYDHPWPGGVAKNKMPNAIPKTETKNGITFTLDDKGVFTIRGTATLTTTCGFPLPAPFVIPSGDPSPKIAFNNTDVFTYINFGFFNGAELVDNWDLVPAMRVSSYTFMQGKTCDKYVITVSNGATVNATLSPMIVDNSVTDYSFSPYSNYCPISGFTSVTATRTDGNDGNVQSVTIQLPETVYGGTLNVTTGEMVVDMASVDMGTLNYTLGGSNTVRQIWASSIATAPAKSTDDIISALSSQFKPVSYNEQWLPYMIFHPSQSNNTLCISVPPDMYSSGSDVKSAMSGVQLVYKLATPITYHLTPQQLTTVLGTNHITSNAGKVSVTYRGDITNIYNNINLISTSTIQSAVDAAVSEVWG